MKRSIGGIFIALLLLCGVPSVHALDEMTMATSDWPPYEYVQDGKNVGFATEVLEEVLTKLGYTLKIEIMPWKRATEMAKAGEMDAVYSASENAERAEFLYFPKTALHPSEYVFFIRKADAGKLKFDSLDDIKDHKVGVTRGYAYSDELLKKLDELKNSEEANSDDLNFEKLVGGRIEYFPAELLNGLFLIKKMGIQDQVTFLEKRIKVKDYFIAFSKKSPKISPEFVEKFANELKAFKETDKYKAIEAKYSK